MNPTCLYNDSDEDNHSTIIGYAFDGFPIYGAYGYAEALSIGETIVMTSGYQLRNISSRQTLADGTNLPAYQYGPTIGGQYPLGSFIQDYEYVAGSGSLDEHNGRFCVTPEYPEGTFAYFVTIDEYLDLVYPYVIGPTYFGNVATGNTGPQSGHNNIPSFAENYSPDSDECLGDINGDGARTIIDLLLILGEFGCMSSCSADIDGDGTVTVGDALNFLSMFGQDC